MQYGARSPQNTGIMETAIEEVNDALMESEHSQSWHTMIRFWKVVPLNVNG